jgi:hypothetical protein
MPLTKTVVIDKIEVNEDGTIQVRRATYIEEDGARIAGPTYHRAAYAAGANLAAEDATVQAVAALVWAPAAARTKALAELRRQP